MESKIEKALEYKVETVIEILAAKIANLEIEKAKLEAVIETLQEENQKLSKQDVESAAEELNKELRKGGN